jgi:hypothetical protein
VGWEGTVEPDGVGVVNHYPEDVGLGFVSIKVNIEIDALNVDVRFGPQMIG